MRRPLALQHARQFLRAKLAAASCAVMANGREILHTASLAAIAVGLWWERPSLALIIPGTVIFTSLSWSHLRRGSD